MVLSDVSLLLSAFNGISKLYYSWKAFEPFSSLYKKFNLNRSNNFFGVPGKILVQIQNLEKKTLANVWSVRL